MSARGAWHRRVGPLLCTVVAAAAVDAEAASPVAVTAIDPSWRETTIEQLLRHDGGAPATPDPRDWSRAWGCSESSRACRRAFVESILSRPIAQPRGTSVYSNQGYAIAGAMIEEILDEGFESALVQRLLEPIGITSAGFGAPPDARGHAPKGAPNTIDNPSAITPAGRVPMSMEDRGRFIALHLKRDGGEALPIRRGDFDRMHAVAAAGGAAGGAASGSAEGAAESAAKVAGEREGMALGWLVTHRRWGGRVLTQAGSNTQWYCVAWLAPERGFAVIAATNQGGEAATRACDAAVALFIGAYLEAAGGSPPAPAAPVPGASSPSTPDPRPPVPRAPSATPSPPAGD